MQGPHPKGCGFLCKMPNLLRKNVIREIYIREKKIVIHSPKAWKKGKIDLYTELYT